MKERDNNLDRLRDIRPFKVPDGYLESLTEQVMSKLPERQAAMVQHVSFADRVRPWLYLAAVFAGLGLFFKAIVGSEKQVGVLSSDSLLVQMEVQAGTAVREVNEVQFEEDEDYYEYLEEEYADIILSETWMYSE